MATPPMIPPDDSAQAPMVQTQPRAPKNQLYALIGKPGSPEHVKTVADLVERVTFQLMQLQPYWDKSQKWFKMYFADRPEFRQLPEEAWRAKVFVPLPYSGIETKTAILTDILTSTDPQIQAEGVLSQNYEPAQKVERLLDYTVRSNHWKGKRLPGLVRMAGIQGTSIYKLTWMDDTYEVEIPSGPEDVSEFTKRLGDSFDALNIQNPDQVPDHMMDPEGFSAFRQNANKALSGNVQIPEPPTTGKTTIVRYRGPRIEQLSLYDTFYDPLIDDMQDQTLVTQRIVKPRSWVMAKVESGAWDAASVEWCLKGGSQDNRPTRQDEVINDILGIKQALDRDPIIGDTLVEIWEVWQPSSKTPYGIILNRRGFVNRNPGTMPFIDGQIPIGLLRNVYVPGRAIGVSELQINESLFEEQNTMRELRIDRTKLETMPAFTYQQGIGMPELKRKIAPGMLIPGRAGMFSPLFQFSATNAFEDMNLTERNAADANATYDNVKGAPAAIGRVSATDASSRTSLANTRHKLQATGFEDDLAQFADQSVVLWYQKGTPDLRVRIAGAPDSPVSVSKTDLMEALHIKFRFRGATQAINRDTLAQKLTGLLKEGNPIMTPVELRSALKTLVDQLGVPNAPMIVSPEGDAFFQGIFEMTQAKQQMEAKQMQLQMAAAAAPVPAEVSVGDAAALAQPSGGPGAPSGPPPPPQPSPMAPGPVMAPPEMPS